MKKNIMLLLAFSMVSIGMFSCSPNDAKLKEKIQSRFKSNPEFSEVQVSVLDGRAILNGTVSFDMIKSAATMEANRVIGVESVENNLKVRTVPSVHTQVMPVSNKESQ